MLVTDCGGVLPTIAKKAKITELAGGEKVPDVVEVPLFKMEIGLGVEASIAIAIC